MFGGFRGQWHRIVEVRPPSGTCTTSIPTMHDGD
jgi:hypothetical protein